MIPPAAPLLERLETRAHAHPDKTAFLDGDQATSYGALWRAAMRWRDALIGVIAPGDRVALLLDNGFETAAAGYGAWAAGGVWVGLNTGLKRDDLLWQIRQCGARALVAGGKYAAVADAAGQDGVAVWRMPAGTPPEQQAPAASAVAGDAVPTTTPRPATDAHAPAAIIYTSGTTGIPKGVVLTHGNLSANVAAIQQALPMREDDITLCLLPFFYAYGFSVLHTHLSLGATLVLEHSLMYPQKVLQRMADTGVTAFYGVPSSYYVMLERGHLVNARLPSLRYCAQAGGAMDPARIDEVVKTQPQAAFYVMYGQTEACSRLTTLPDAMRAARPGSVGLPLEGVALSIQAEDGTALGPGQTGEVCARGPNVMQGYWQAPEDTAQALRGGWLRTGDLGHLDADGCLYLTGRSREQIKTGAHRVSPWEIEQLIQTVPGVREAAVTGEPDHLLGETVHAYVIADEPSDMLRRAILQACKARLAAYKVPRHLSFLPQFPRTASGKVRKHLLAPLPSTPTGSAT